MSETGAIMLAAFCARNVSRTPLSASEWADILCVCLCPFPETGIVCGKLHQLTTVVHPPFALNIHNCTFHKTASSEAKSSKMCMRYRSIHCFLFYLIYFSRLAGVCLWTINTGHAISTPCYTRNAQTSKWRVINWRSHNSFVNWQGWKKRKVKKRDVMGGKGIRNEGTREQAVFLLVTAMRRHQRSFPPDINNMALSVFFVALSFSLSLFPLRTVTCPGSPQDLWALSSCFFWAKNSTVWRGRAGNYIFFPLWNKPPHNTDLSRGPFVTVSSTATQEREAVHVVMICSSQLLTRSLHFVTFKKLTSRTYKASVFRL